MAVGDVPKTSALASANPTTAAAGERGVQGQRLFRRLVSQPLQPRAALEARLLCLFKDLTTLTEDEIVAELVYGARAVFEVVGKTPRYFRPPCMCCYSFSIQKVPSADLTSFHSLSPADGAIDDCDDCVRLVAAFLGLQAVKWSHDTED
ncbi:hypothetical protein BJ741DRAFT_9920 [Chytriomyces cf. hyalinus JEL632]|nr:hypothetical protein BJ741DRAFT_9920 [Chytriomyces cf. hyalinus JEL632]